MATAGASVTTSAGARSDAHAKPTAAQNGTRRRNSSSSHKRPSSAPGDTQLDSLRPLSTNGLDQRPQIAHRPSKPPLLRSKSDHPSRLVENSADSSNDEQTVVAGAEELGTRHGFDGHYQSEDIISQLANVGALFSLLIVTHWLRSKSIWRSWLTHPGRVGTCIIQTKGTKHRGSPGQSRSPYRIGG